MARLGQEHFEDDQLAAVLHEVRHVERVHLLHLVPAVQAVHVLRQQFFPIKNLKPDKNSLLSVEQ